MPKRIYLTRPVIKILVVVDVVIAFALYIYITSGMPAPRESDRVAMPDASYSIIKPHGWYSKTQSDPEDAPVDSHIEIWQPGMAGVLNFIIVSRLREAPLPENLPGAGMTVGTFMGHDAYFRTTEKPREFVWRMLFQNEGRWYDLLVHLRYKEQIPESDWWQFVTSFKSVPHPTSQPATTQMNAAAIPSQSV